MLFFKKSKPQNTEPAAPAQISAPSFEGEAAIPSSNFLTFNTSVFEKIAADSTLLRQSRASSGNVTTSQKSTALL